VGSSSWPYVERYLGVSLILSRLEVLKDWHLVDETKGEGTEVISTSFGSRDYKELKVRIEKELVTYKS
jgi:hypothetical protein